MGLTSRSDTGLRALLVAAAFVVVVAGLKAAAAVIVPVLASGLVAVLFIPAVAWLQRRRVPDWAAVPLVFLGVLVVFGGLSAGLGKSISDFNDNLEGYGDALEERFGSTLTWVSARLEPHGVELTPSLLVEHLDPRALLRTFGDAAGAAADLLSNTLFVLLTVAFILSEAAGFPRKLAEAFGGRDVVAGQYEHAVASIRSYVRIKTLVSLATGALAFVLVSILGIDYPVLWGVVAFLLNYVPTVGSLVAAVPPILLAIVQFGWQRAVVAAIGYAVVNIVIGNVVEPRVMGRKLGLSGLVVWLSLVFWGWVWGPIGMLLSVPLTMLAKLLLEEWDDLRWIAVLLGPGGEDLDTLAADGGARERDEAEPAAAPPGAPPAAPVEGPGADG